MAGEKKGELESDKGQWITNKTRLENIWADNPNVPTIGPLASAVATNAQQLGMDESNVQQDLAQEQEKLKLRLMKEKPPEGGSGKPGNSSDFGDDSDSPLQAMPFKNKPK